LEDLFLPLSIALGLVTFGLMAKWYLLPALHERSLRDALTPLLLLHGFRYVGLAFLLPGVTAAPLDLRFANPAAYGDLLASVLALIALFALRADWRFALSLVWIFNLEGTLDLLNALFQGLRYTTDADLGATYFIPAVIVPALLVTHYVIFALLLHRRDPKPATDI
jgi:hypothetical protein